MIGFESHVRGNITVTEALQVRHQVSLPVLLVLLVLVVACLLSFEYLVHQTPTPDRFTIVGCQRQNDLCIIFDTATGRLGLSDLPRYPGAIPAGREEN